MKGLDEKLDQIQNVQELDPFTTALGTAVVVGTTRLIAQLVTFLLTVSALKNQLKVDNSMTRRLNEILKGRWVVHVYPDSDPNAFAVGGKHVFITSGLKKLLNQREIEAVLLHEVYHNKDLHIWKQFAANHTFTYLILYIAISVSMATGAFYLAFMGFILTYQIYTIFYNRFVGRKQELKADEYAVKLGYGKDIASALSKMETYVDKLRSKSRCGKICQLERKISDAIDEHPPMQKRVEIILRKTNDLAKVMKSASFAKIKNFVTKVFTENG